MKTEIALETGIKAVKAEARVPRWVMPVTKALIFAADAALAVFCFLVAFSLRSGDPILSSTAWAWSTEFVPYVGILFFAVPVRLAMLLYQRVYRYSGAFSYTQEAIKIFKATAISSLLIVAWAFLFRGGFAFREFSYSRACFRFRFCPRDRRFRRVSSNAALHSVKVSRTRDQSDADTDRRNERRGRPNDPRASRAARPWLSRDRCRLQRRRDERKR